MMAGSTVLQEAGGRWEAIDRARRGSGDPARSPPRQRCQGSRGAALLRSVENPCKTARHSPCFDDNPTSTERSRPAETRFVLLRFAFLCFSLSHSLLLFLIRASPRLHGSFRWTTKLDIKGRVARATRSRASTA